MKSAVVFLIFAAVSYAFEGECRGDFLKTALEECVTEHGGDKGHIDDLLDLKKARDENGKCLRACLMKKCKFLNDDHKINEDVPKRMAHLLYEGDDNKFKAIEDAGVKCLGLQNYEENMCNNAETFNRCYVKHCSTCNLDLRSLVN